MKIAVVGLGGVGAYIGAKLCSLKNEHEIIFVARGEHLHTIQKEGLRIIEMGEESVYHPSYAKETLCEPVDILFLCTKTYHTQEAILKLSSALSKDTLIIPIANGVNSQELISSLTQAKVSDACVYIVSHITAPGIITKSTKVFALVLSADLQDLLAPLLDKADLRTKFSEDIDKEIWKKFLFISAMGTMTSYYQKGMGSIYKDHTKELTELLHEIFSVAKLEDIHLEEKEIDKALHTASKLPLDAPTSLWLDMQSNEKNELDSLCYYLIKTANRHKISLPVMQKLYNKLK